MEIPEIQLRIEPKDLEITATRGTGPGGQARNTTDSCIQITHKPTRLQVRCDTERSQHQNKATAMSMLRAKLWENQQERQTSAVASSRKQQVGSGMRADKRRTIRWQDGQVHDHVTGKRWRLSDYIKGEW